MREITSSLVKFVVTWPTVSDSLKECLYLLIFKLIAHHSAFQDMHIVMETKQIPKLIIVAACLGNMH